MALTDSSLAYSPKTPLFAAIFTFLAIGYYNLTPLAGIDCWWHMRFAEYFLKTGTPVLYDPFAIQSGEKILATYPDLFPGTLFLLVFKHFSYLGLNILRISVYMAFFAALMLVVRKSWQDYVALTQVLLLALAMAGRELLQPDLFNYLLFVIWIYLLEQITSAEQRRWHFIVSLCVVEQIWVNSHPLFFYHGLFIASIYLLWSIMVTWRQNSKATPMAPPLPALLCAFLLLHVIWLFNPLGWRALESVFVNMLDPRFANYATRPFFKSLNIVNTYLYLLIPAIFIMRKPWTQQRPLHQMALHTIVLLATMIPAFVYERCLPFMCIYAIICERHHTRSSSLPRRVSGLAALLILLTFGLFTIIDRNLLIFPQLANTTGLVRYTHTFHGIGINYIHPMESVRETLLINSLAVPGNCLTNALEIASSAVWHCPDKPFFIYGNGAVMNKRYPELTAFLANITANSSKQMIYKYDIKTLIFSNCNDKVFEYYPVLSEYLQLIYIDPHIAILARKDSITEQQRERIKWFYSHFRPGVMDAQRLDHRELGEQYFLLWFSAEMTGQDGAYYQKAAMQLVPPEGLARLKEKLVQLLPDGKHAAMEDAPGGK